MYISSLLGVSEINLTRVYVWIFQCRMRLIVDSSFFSRFIFKGLRMLCVVWPIALSYLSSPLSFVCVVYFGFVFSLCCQSFSGSVTVTMAGSTQTAQIGNTGHATVNTNSQTHTSSEQQLPAPTLLHYPCKICGK